MAIDRGINSLMFGSWVVGLLIIMGGNTDFAWIPMAVCGFCAGRISTKRKPMRS